jgi:hypothetical protein
MKGTEMSILSRSHKSKSTDTSVIVKRLALSLLVVLAFRYSGQAQINANATFSGVQAGVNYDYTITLHNTAASTGPIETFWFAWVPGEDFLPSNPLSVQPPSGWTDGVTHGGAGDGYGIEFVTSTTPLTPGNSMTFQFQSADTPAALAADSPYYPTTPVGTSFVYQGSPFVTPSQSFVVQPVPEPSVLALFLVACIALLRVTSSGSPATNSKLRTKN